MTNITFPLTAENVAQVVAERDAEIERLRNIAFNAETEAMMLRKQAKTHARVCLGEARAEIP